MFLKVKQMSAKGHVGRVVSPDQTSRQPLLQLRPPATHVPWCWPATGLRSTGGSVPPSMLPVNMCCTYLLAALSVCRYYRQAECQEPISVHDAAGLQHLNKIQNAQRCAPIAARHSRHQGMRTVAMLQQL